MSLLAVGIDRGFGIGFNWSYPPLGLYPSGDKKIHQVTFFALFAKTLINASMVSHLVKVLANVRSSRLRISQPFANGYSRGRL
jgi:hypothetical protein